MRDASQKVRESRALLQQRLDDFKSFTDTCNASATELASQVVAAKKAALQSRLTELCDTGLAFDEDVLFSVAMHKANWVGARYNKCD